MPSVVGSLRPLPHQKVGQRSLGRRHQEPALSQPCHQPHLAAWDKQTARGIDKDLGLSLWVRKVTSYVRKSQ